MAATSVKQVFISHASEADGDFARRLAGDLRRLGVPVWIAPDSIRPGEGWVRAIERGMGESSHVVIALTPDALASQWVDKETEVAIAEERAGRIQVIPLDVKPCQVPLLLRSYQMISFRQDYNAGLGQLAGILGLSPAPAEPTPARPRAPERARAPVVERRQPLELELIRIPAGEFLMGSDPKKDKDAFHDEQPQHTLHLPEYYMAKTRVTNGQYLAFVEATGQKPPKHWEGGKPPAGKEEHLVVHVRWHDAMAYCQWLAKATGKAYRLPSEAEWEKAARGTDGRIWPWGNEWDPTRRNSEEGGRGDTTPVSRYSPGGVSPYGCEDMTGNGWEWTRSLRKGYPYDPEDGRENPEARGARALRGGPPSDSNPANARISCRNAFLPVRFFYDHIGFRVCVVAQQE